MKRFAAALRRFFLPPSDATLYVRILPLFFVAFLVVVIFLFGNFAWEETNTVSFCGLTCHTMPPEYVTHANSVHTNVTCEDCHMGRDRFFVLAGRKIRYSWQTGTAMLFNTYEYPIIAHNMAPAREACENCHKPEVFSTDAVVEMRRFAQDETNAPSSTFLAIKTGGGSARQGLGFGIHWHIENPVEYYAEDERDQIIPYVRVTNADGSTTEYVDIESGFDPSSIQPGDLETMDCITCHNRTAHEIKNPDQLMDELLARNLVSPTIPFIKRNGVEVLNKEYNSQQEALDAIAALMNQYQAEHPEFYQQNYDLLVQSVESIQAAFLRTVFPDQEVDWETHPDNIGHSTAPGCFRCHDGKHLTAESEAIRLECNLCHSIPVVSAPTDLTASLPLNKGFEPESHKNTNWITLHRTVFDDSCQGCHTVEDPGGTSNTSFCSNSACHGSSWDFAGFDAPRLREVLGDQALLYSTPTPSGEPATQTTAQPTTQASTGTGEVRYSDIAGILESRCGSCHGSNAMQGLNVTTYEGIMAGGEGGPAVIPGEPENSLLIQIQTGTTKHFGQFTEEELEQVVQWIESGAPE